MVRVYDGEEPYEAVADEDKRDGGEQIPEKLYAAM